MDIPETRYAKTDDGVFIAYQVVGVGPVDVVFAFNDDEGNVDLMWEEPDWRPFLEGPTEFGRVITYDRRGTGVSSRNVQLPNLETQVSDLLAVIDAAGSARPLLVGGSMGGAVLSVFAATHPDRVRGLLWNNPVAKLAWSPDYPWGQGPDDYERDLRESELWGTQARGVLRLEPRRWGLLHDVDQAPRGREPTLRWGPAPGSELHPHRPSVTVRAKAGAELPRFLRGAACSALPLRWVAHFDDSILDWIDGVSAG